MERKNWDWLDLHVDKTASYISCGDFACKELGFVLFFIKKGIESFQRFALLASYVNTMSLIYV